VIDQPTDNGHVADDSDEVLIADLEAEATAAALAKVATRCRWDLYYLCSSILDYNLMTEPVHGDLTSYLLPVSGYTYDPKRLPVDTEETKGTSDQYDRHKTNYLFLMPRGTFKSSVVTIGFTLQKILNDPDVRILIDSETHGKAKAFFREIKGHLENNYKYREVFKAIHGMYPDQGKKKSTLWSESKLTISCRKRWRKEPTIDCGGIDTAKNGMHYDVIVGDDFHSEKNVTTKEQIQQVIDHYKLAYSLLDPGGIFIVIGTRWDYSDLYQYILDEERSRFNILIRRAIDPVTGDLFFPERLDRDFLKAQRKTQGSYIFSCQYLNEPVDDESATFKRSWMRRKKEEDIQGRPMNDFLFIDPSYKGENSDYCGMALAGMDYMRDLYVKHLVREKLSYGQIVLRTFDLNERFHPRRIGIEVVGAAGKALMHEFHEEQKRRGVWLPIVELSHNDSDKLARIAGLEPMYEFAHIWHVAGCPELEELEYELIHYPRSAHDDVSDALAGILEIATPPANHTRPTQNSGSASDRRSQQQKYKPRSSITGV
jgi:predicted phage terminase large subunit-like protein